MSNTSSSTYDKERKSSSVSVTSPIKRAREEDMEEPIDGAARDVTGARLSQQFGMQGIEYDEKDKVLFCSMCPAPSEGTRISFDVSMEAVLFHCSSRVHLTSYEKAHAEELKEWFPVELHGHRMLLDHNCIYPRTMFGPGRLLMDETIVNGMLIAEDVCGGVALFPLHKYTVTELVLFSSRAFTLLRDNEDEENPEELARCAIEPLASLPTHISAGFYGSKKLRAEWIAIGSHPMKMRLPTFHGGTIEETYSNAHLRFDKMLDSVNMALTTELSLRQEREKDASTADVSKT